jgi:hypothetical protein
LKEYYITRGTLKYIGLFLRKSNLIAELKSERRALVKELEEGKEVYLKSL